MLFKEILICSHKEQKAKKIKLDPKRTLIYGVNDMGKSSLIKTLMATFGAKPAKLNENWKELNPMSLVRFSIDGIAYAILKDDKSYALFDQFDKLIKVCASVTDELGPLLAGLLNFNIQLPDNQHTIITPPPAFIFLPFYVDQDQSWSTNWAGFSSLGQLKSYREPIIFYHTGIRGNDYYATKNETAKYKEEYENLTAETKAIKNLIGNLKEKTSSADFNINVELFKKEIEDLLIECDKLKKIEETHKAKLIDLYNHIISLEAQHKITEGALKESAKDYAFAAHKLSDAVECPTCGAEYENTFAERFEIALDRSRCDELLLEINGQLLESKKQIDRENALLNKTITEIINIELLLRKKRGEIQLKDVIENAGVNHVHDIFSQNLLKLNNDLIENQRNQLELEARWKSLENKVRKNEIELFYLLKMESNLSSLGVSNLNRSAYKGVLSKINDTGSSLPRALMAYYFAIFETINKYSTSIFCPLVIDSPNQQAQDRENINIIYEFIKENQPADTQLILGLEDLYGLDFECPIVELTEKNSLLVKGEFSDVFEEISPFYRQVIDSRGTLF
jgi:hypothetical protein